MALRCMIAALLIALANIRLSACVVVTGKISCLDCHDHKTIPLSGIQVLVKCDGVRKLSSATTEDNGFFEAELPSSHSSCLAKVLGGPHQLYATRSGMVSKITESRDGSGNSAFTTSTPLVISTTCPKGKACRDKSGFGSSKTFDLPVPREWGLAPTSYYLPFIPIIGIP